MLGACFYRRRQYRLRKAPSQTIEFNRDAFTEKKNPYLASNTYDPFKANVTSYTYHTKYPGSQTSISTKDSEDNFNPTVLAWKPQINTQFRVTNAASEGSSSAALPTFPQTAAEKKKATRSKPPSLSMNPEDMVGSPPPSYDIASGGQQFPVPTLMPPEKMRTIPAPPTPPASRKSFQSKKKSFHGQNLVIPNEDIPKAVPSPARSESFAPKDGLVSTPSSAPPVSAASSKAKLINSPATSNPFSPAPSSATTESQAPKTVRLMNVVAPYTPTLADELQVRVGDTVRVLQEYKDGWCFAQFVGKVDAPRGVVPLVCLEERRRVVPVSSKGSNSSLTSLVNWR